MKVKSTYPRDPAIRAELAKLATARGNANSHYFAIKRAKACPSKIADAKEALKGTRLAYQQARIDAVGL